MGFDDFPLHFKEYVAVLFFVKHPAQINLQSARNHLTFVFHAFVGIVDFLHSVQLVFLYKVSKLVIQL